MLTIHPLGDPDQLGLHGLRDDRIVDLERGCDWRLQAGYDVAGLIADGLDVRLNTAVTELQWAADGVTAVTDTRERVEAYGGMHAADRGVEGERRALRPGLAHEQAAR